MISPPCTHEGKMVPIVARTLSGMVGGGPRTVKIRYICSECETKVHKNKSETELTEEEKAVWVGRAS